MELLPDGEDIELVGEVSTWGVRRCPDGRAVFAVSPHEAGTKTYAMVISAQNVMAIVGFLLNRPARGAMH